MKALLPALVFLFALAIVPARAQQSFPGLPDGMKGNYETVEGTIEKVYAAEHNGFRSQAYVVKWNGQDVVVPEMFSRDQKKVGDKITYLVQEMELPILGKKVKTLQFMCMDMSAVQEMAAAALKAANPSPAPAGSPAK